MIFSDFDDDLGLPKNSPAVSLVAEELSEHSVEVLKKRLDVLRMEIKRTDQAIADKGDARVSAESIFK